MHIIGYCFLQRYNAYGIRIVFQLMVPPECLHVLTLPNPWPRPNAEGGQVKPWVEISMHLFSLWEKWPGDEGLHDESD